MILSLCSGYGGLDMAVEQVTGDRVGHVAEIDKHAGAVLAIRYPDAPNLGDIKAFDWAALPRPDWLTAGLAARPDLPHRGTCHRR